MAVVIFVARGQRFRQPALRPQNLPSEHFNCVYSSTVFLIKSLSQGNSCSPFLTLSLFHFLRSLTLFVTCLNFRSPHGSSTPSQIYYHLSRTWPTTPMIPIPIQPTTQACHQVFPPQRLPITTSNTLIMITNGTTDLPNPSTVANFMVLRCTSIPNTR